MRNHTSSEKSKEKALAQWGSPKTVDDVIAVFVKYTAGGAHYNLSLDFVERVDLKVWVKDAQT